MNHLKQKSVPTPLTLQALAYTCFSRGKKGSTLSPRTAGVSLQRRRVAGSAEAAAALVSLDCSVCPRELSLCAPSNWTVSRQRITVKRSLKRDRKLIDSNLLEPLRCCPSSTPRAGRTRRPASRRPEVACSPCCPAGWGLPPPSGISAVLLLSGGSSSPRKGYHKAGCPLHSQTYWSSRCAEVLREIREQLDQVHINIL